MGSPAFTPIDNPYVVGNPIKDPSMFFGGAENFEYIREKVGKGADGGLLVLCGPRRCGKTSTLYQILNGRLGELYFPVMIDMQVMTDLTVENTFDFLVKLGEHIVEALRADSATPGDARLHTRARPATASADDAHTADAAARTGVGDDVSIDQYLSESSDESPTDAFQRFIKDVTLRIGNRTLLLLFDEYEYFEEFIDSGTLSKEVFRLFANWIEHRRVFIIFAGSDEIERRKAYWADLLRKTPHYRRIEFLSESNTLNLINSPLRDIAHYDDGVPEKIYELTAGQPFYTQDICQNLIDDLNRAQSYNITDEQLERIVEAGIRNPKPDMIFSWNRLGRTEKLALSIVGELNRDEVTPVTAQDVRRFHKKEKLGFRMSRNALNEALEKLFHRQILEQETHGTFTFKMDLWRRWVSRMHSIWQALDETGPDPNGSVSWRVRALAGVGTVAAIAVAIFVFNTFSPDPQPSPVPVPPAPAQLALVSFSTDPVGADVYVRGDLRGRTPFDSLRVPPGKASVSIELAGYAAVAETLTLVAGELTARNTPLVPLTGSLRVTSEPLGAAITINGQRQAQVTPHTFENLPVTEAYTLVVQKTGYETVRHSGIRLTENAVITSHNPLLVATAETRISTTPEGATLTVDGEQMPGETPDFYTLSHGAREITATLTGYEPKTETVRIPADGDRVNITLKRSPPGTLVVKVRPYGDIFVDGIRKVEKSHRYEGPQPAGEHTVKVTHPKFGEAERQVDVASRERHEIEIDMRKEGRQQ